MIKEKILILDVLDCPGMRLEFESFGHVLVDASEFTKNITGAEKWNSFDRSNTLLVFPGNGASILRSYLPGEWLLQWHCVGVGAKRYWRPGEDPHIVVHRIFPERMILGIQDVVILDDVISSGQTCRKLRRVNMPWIPSAKWHAVTWVRQRGGAKLSEFTSLHSALEVGVAGPNHTDGVMASIQSLSTLIRNEKIALSYARRNLSELEGEKFLDVLQRLR
jgi:hypothetical protein